MNDLARFRSKYQVEVGGQLTNGAPCWLWTAGIGGHGYGGFFCKGKDYSAHKWHYEQTVKPVDAGKELHHECGVRHCVNPAHLKEVTRSQHIALTPTHCGKQNAAKTHCPFGHPLATKRNKHGSRICPTCKANNQRKRRGTAVPQVANNKKTHCRNGHEFTPENTIIVKRSDGRQERLCRICYEASRERKKKKGGS